MAVYFNLGVVVVELLLTVKVCGHLGIVAGDNCGSIEVDNVGSHLAVVAGHHLRVDVVGHYLVLDSSMLAFKNCPGSLERFALLAGQHQH